MQIVHVVGKLLFRSMLLRHYVLRLWDPQVKIRRESDRKFVERTKLLYRITSRIMFQPPARQEIITYFPWLYVPHIAYFHLPRDNIWSRPHRRESIFSGAIYSFGFTSQFRLVRGTL